MSGYFRVLLVAVFCVLGMSLPATAQRAYGTSILSYDSSTNLLNSYSSTEMDYLAASQYRPSVGGTLYQVGGATVQAGNKIGSYGSASVSLMLSGTAQENKSYAINSAHDLSIINYTIPPGGNSQYYDSYNFENAFASTTSPNSWLWFGPGPSVISMVQNIHLGESFASLLVPAKPKITGPTNVWWFNGASPPNYSSRNLLEIQLTTNQTASTYQWSIVYGQGFADLIGTTRGDTVTTSTSGVKLIGTDASVAGGVWVQVKVNGIWSDKFKVTVRAPHRIVLNSKKHFPSETTYYETHMEYRLEDQTQSYPPYRVEITECWATNGKPPSPLDCTNGPIKNEPSFSNCNWRRQDPGTWVNADPMRFIDHIEPEHRDALHLPNPYPTTPPVPPAPLSKTLVQSWLQDWYIGDSRPGYGRRVQRNTLQRFIDHGDHYGRIEVNPPLRIVSQPKETGKGEINENP